MQALAGAKNHLVVMPDANLDAAVPALFSSAFSNAGERCLAGSVAVGVGDVADELSERLATLAREARLAPGLGQRRRPGFHRDPGDDRRARSGSWTGSAAGRRGQRCS